MSRGRAELMPRRKSKLLPALILAAYTYAGGVMVWGVVKALLP